jgi:TPR repeat protein
MYKILKIIVASGATLMLGGCDKPLTRDDFRLDNRIIIHEKSGSRALYTGRKERDTANTEHAIAAFRDALNSGYPAIRTEAARELAQLLYAQRGIYDKEILTFVVQAAKEGDVAAITMLAQACIAQNKTEYALALVAPIAKNHLPARRLWVMLREEKGEDVSAELAALVKDYEGLAQAGDVSAHLPLAQLYNREDMAFYDAEKAREYYTLLAHQGETAAYFPLATLHHKTGNVEEAVTYYEKAAQLGNIRAVKLLAEGYAPKGWGEEDPARQAHWLEVLAKGGDTKAMMQRGFIAMKAQEMTQAAEWFSRAVTADSSLNYTIGKKLITLPNPTQAQRNLAKTYLIQAEKAGDTRAVPLLKKHTVQQLTTLAQVQQTAALFSQHPEIGDSRLAYRLYSAFLKHNQPKEAIIWLKEAAKRGSLKASNLLADYYRTGQYVAMDMENAHHYTIMAAQRGDNKAAYLAGLNYARGLGVEKDVKQARYWLSKASKGGIKDADAVLSGLSGQQPANKE